MDHLQALNEIQTRDFPSFFLVLEEKYGKKWMEKYVAFMAVLCEDSAGGLFRSLGGGRIDNLMRVAHAAIRHAAKFHLAEGKFKDEKESMAYVISLIGSALLGDLSREGVPDSIFEGVMREKNEKPDEVSGS